MVYQYSYPRPALTCDALLLCCEAESLLVLLIQRKGEPYKGKWALPGGFVEMNEELASACVRELEEETGLKNVRLKQFRTYGTVGRDPRGRTVSVVFYAEIATKATPSAGDDAAQAAWFPVDRLPELAFDHQQIIADYLKYRSKKKF